MARVSIKPMTDHLTHATAGAGPHQLMLGSVTVTRLLGGEQTGGELAMMQLSGLPGSGPGPHMDPWRESFYVLEGELTFRFEQDGVVQSVLARAGDAVSIPAGVGHAFTVSGAEPARYLILGTPAGIDTFFADAGESLERPLLPQTPAPFDRERLLAAFAKHGLPSSYSFPDEAKAS